ncbi:MAG: rubrerythrin [Selenomonadaceae bacterium]|nr:rubrerythrin [Selenomonadaceae bacterium]
MSLHGLTKGSELEPMIEQIATAEAIGAAMYYAFARIAKEDGFEDVAKKFIAAANQEAFHAGFYSTLNGKFPRDFWKLLPALMKGEYEGKASIQAIADKIRAADLDPELKEIAAKETEILAQQEHGHGDLVKKILEDHRPELLEVDADPNELMKYLM